MTEVLDRSPRDAVARQRISDHIDRCEERWRDSRSAQEDMRDDIKGIYTLLKWCIGLGVTAQSGLLLFLASHVLVLK